MRYKSPGIGSITAKGKVTYLPPGYDDNDIKDEIVAGAAGETSFTNLTVTGKITTRDLSASGEITADSLVVDSGSDLAGGVTADNVEVTGDLTLAETSNILHGSWRTRVDGDGQYREYWDGAEWKQGDIVSP